ncbi:MAG: intermembrane phospholipid transport protein YdbH family protein [Thermodesulfobacteriota bacterium]
MIKKLVTKMLIAGAVLGVAWFCWQMAVNVLLAGWLEAAVIPNAAKQAGISRARVAIVKLGLFETVAGPVMLGNKDRPFLEAASIRARYTPWGALRGHIQRVTVSGVVLNAQYTDDGVVLPGFTPVPAAPAREAGQKTDTGADSLPVSVDTIRITGAMVNLLAGDHLFQVPCDASLAIGGKGTTAVNAGIDLFPCGQKITLTAQAMLDQGAVFATIDAPALILERFEGWTALLPGLKLSGSASVKGRAHINTRPAELVSASVDFKMATGAAGYQNTVVGPADPDAPLSIAMTGTRETGWRMDSANLALVSPVKLAFDRLAADIQPGAGPGEKQGTFAVGVAPSKPLETDPAFSLAGPVAVAGTFSGGMDDNGWRFDLTAGDGNAENSQDCRIHAGGSSITMPVPQIRVSGNGAAGKGWAELSLSLPRAVVAAADEKITISGTKISATATFAGEPDGQTNAKGDLKLSLGQVHAAGQQADIVKAFVHLPWQWPDGRAPQGSLTIGPVKWKNLNMGVVTGALRQQGRQLRLDAQYGPGVLSGLSGAVTGTASLDGDGGPVMDANLLLALRDTAPDIDLGLFAPGAAGVLVNGNLDLAADMLFHDGSPSGRLECRLDACRVGVPEKKIAIAGISASVILPGLPSLKSSPDQKVAFKEAAFGDIRLADGRIDLQLESGPTLFIEKSSFKWCRGTVYTEGMRLAPGQKDYSLTLYGDRLNLADVLGQLGAVAAEGQGTVSGRIPVLYSNGAIAIDNGFLFSAPGEGGLIHLSKADILTSGLPVESAQYRQIDLAREALKNYQYDWAKVLMNSEGEELSVKLQFDGRPTRSLPFVYDKQQGGFVRVTNEKQYSEFKGLSLDVNFRIPINQLIGYKELLNIKP